MAGVNQEQIDYWNERAGATWAELQERLDALLSPLSAAGLQAAKVRSGERVLDVGCGCGDTSIALSKLGARVLGVDVSAPMLEQARKRDGAIEYLEADAAAEPFQGDFDLVFSRFGVMFFADPVVAFANMAQALRPGGRMHVVCWSGMARNPWFSLPRQAAVVPRVAAAARRARMPRATRCNRSVAARCAASRADEVCESPCGCCCSAFAGSALGTGGSSGVGTSATSRDSHAAEKRENMSVSIPSDSSARGRTFRVSVCRLEVKTALTSAFATARPGWL